jgi:small subunit ribosomal protein S8
MTMTDPIADLLTRIRNALMSKHDRLDIPSSKLKVEVCRILKDEGFIEDYETLSLHPQNRLRVFLRYSERGEPAITRMQRISRPGRRVYRGADAIRPVLNGLGVGVLSTSQGLLTDRQAREQRVGGELLCEIW